MVPEQELGNARKIAEAIPYFSGSDGRCAANDGLARNGPDTRRREMADGSAAY
jgi:hypothetical protein